MESKHTLKVDDKEVSRSLLLNDPHSDLSKKELRRLEDKYSDKFVNTEQFEFFCQLPLTDEQREKVFKDILEAKLAEGKDEKSCEQ